MEHGWRRRFLPRDDLARPCPSTLSGDGEGLSVPSIDDRSPPSKIQHRRLWARTARSARMQPGFRKQLRRQDLLERYLVAKGRSSFAVRARHGADFAPEISGLHVSAMRPGLLDVRRGWAVLAKLGWIAQLRRGLQLTGWWAHQDSNLEPRDSRGPKVSPRRGLSLHPPRQRVGCGTLEPVIKGAAALR